MSISLAGAAIHHHTSPRSATVPGNAPIPWLNARGIGEFGSRNGATRDTAPGELVMSFAPDRRIYDEGDAARSFYKVISGVVRTCHFFSDGRRQIDSFYLPGEVFGFESGSEHRLAAEAVSHCTVVAYRRQGAESLMAEDSIVARQFFRHAMICLEQTRERCLLLGRGSAAQKIAAFLLQMAERTDAASTVELPMGRQDIADYLGLTIETVSRTLSQMEREGTIAMPSTRKVVLKNRRLLEDLTL